MPAVLRNLVSTTDITIKFDKQTNIKHLIISYILHIQQIVSPNF